MAMEHLSVANEMEGLNLKFHFNQLEFEYRAMCHFICSVTVVLACAAHYEVNWLSWYNIKFYLKHKLYVNTGRTGTTCWVLRQPPKTMPRGVLLTHG